MAGPDVSKLNDVAANLREVGDAKSEHTVASYERRLRQWDAFAAHHGIDDHLPTAEEVGAFALARYRAGVSASGVAANLSAIGWRAQQAGRDGGDVTRLAREVLKRERADGGDKPLSPAPVLSLGALEAMAAAPRLGGRDSALAMVLPLLDAPPRQLAAVRVDDVELTSRRAVVRLPAIEKRGYSHDAVAALELVIEFGDARDGRRDAVETLLAVAEGAAVFPLEAVYQLRSDPSRGAGVFPQILVRNRALLGAMFVFALRPEEARKANLTDTLYPEDDVLLQISRSKTNRNGDVEIVGADDRVPFTRTGVDLLNDWVEFRLRGRDFEQEPIVDEPLFTTIHHTGPDGSERLTTGEIRGILQAMATQVGLPDAVSGHSLRRTWATQAYLAGVPIEDISAHLRHSKLDTTTRYIEDLELHLIDAATMTDPDVVRVGPGGQKQPAKNVGFVDEPLDALVAEVRDMTFGSPLAASTLDGIASYWRTWESWADEFGFPAFPADPRVVALFAAERAKTVAANTLRAQMSALDHVHRSNGMPATAFTRMAADLIEGLGREQRDRPLKQAPVIPRPELLAMAELCRTGQTAPRSRDTADDVLRDLVEVTVGYAGGLRMDDLHRSRIENLEPVDVGYVLRLSVSKLNQSGARGDVVLLQRRDDALDPVSAIDEWLNMIELDEGPLLLAVPPTHPPRPIATETMVDRLQRLAARAGCSVRPTGHSLRRSWSTHAYKDGLDLLKISRHLRHKRVTMTERYVEGLSPWPNNPAAQMIGDRDDDR